MSLAFNIGVTPFSGHRVGLKKGLRMAMAKKSYVTVKSSLTTTDLLGELKEKLKREGDDSRATAPFPPSDVPSSLCIIDTLERLGVDRHFQSEIDTILEKTYSMIIFAKLIVNEVAVMAGVEQGRDVKGFLVELWIEMLLAMKIELDTWTDSVQLSLDECMCKSWISPGCRMSLLMSSLFLAVKLSEEMLRSEECSDLCRHVSTVLRLLNNVTTFE
ncbi:hypothetical protein SASPL_153384 [Salvia splendens]|uniref:Terpene synthase N-terminal domain-containing protein n=1 Tax=Salvia splendens TaxID=180675 RepID=A0A8X8W4Q7_SALSN|nr:hypothetical protein SASPL_153384 [Salvia splendens]